MADNIIQIIIRAKDGASAELRKLDGSLKAFGLTAGAFTVAAAGTATALAAFAIEGGKEANEIRLLGAQSGQSAEQMSRLKFAADQNHVSIDAVAASLKFMNKNLFDAKTGGGPAIKALNDLGFSSEQLRKGLGTSNEAFLAIIDRLNKVGDAGTRTAETLKIFGRGAIEIAPLVNVGVDAIKRLEAESDAAGATISNAAAVIGAKFGEASNKIKDQVEGLKARIAVALLPTMTQVAEGVSRAFAGFNKFVAGNPTLVQAVAVTALAFAGIGAAMVGLIVIVPILTAALASLGVSLAAFSITGGVVALAAFAYGALLKRMLDVRTEADKPLEIHVSTDALDAGNQLAKLSLELSKLEQQANDIKSRHANDGSATNLGGSIAAGVRAAGAATGISFLQGFGLDADTGKLIELNRQLGVGHEHLTQLADDAKRFGTTAGSGLAAAGDAAKFTTEQLVDAAVKAGDLQKALDLVHFDGLPSLQDALKGVDALLSTPRFFKITVDKDGALKSVKATQAEVQSFLDGNPDNLKLSAVKPRSQEELGRALPTISEKALPQPKLAFELDHATAEAARLFVALDALGIPAEDLNKKLIAAHQSLETLGGQAIVLGETIKGSFRRAFDPLLNAVGESEQAVGAFAQSSTQALNGVFTDMIVKGASAASALKTFFAAVGQTIKQLIADLVAMIAKLLIIRAIKALIGGGGTPFDHAFDHIAGDTSGFSAGGQIKGFNAGGQIAHFAAGGAIAAGLALSSLPHYADGAFRSIPGSPQAHDSVLAMLAPGEAVLPTVGGLNPGNVVARLASLEQRLATAKPQPMPTAGPIVGAVHIHAFDADSVREQTRRGALDRQLARSLDLGRGVA